MSDFQRDLTAARDAEYLALGVFSKIAPACHFIHVGADCKYYDKGDIKASTLDGRTWFIEVKDDSCIYKTGNVLCEEENFFFGDGAYKDGCMKTSQCNIYAVVSRKERKIYCIDFRILKENYKKGEYR